MADPVELRCARTRTNGERKAIIGARCVWDKAASEQRVDAPPGILIR
jgi:hypothetical protein